MQLEPLFERYADANTKYAELWKTDNFEISPAIVTRLPKFSWTELPQPFRDLIKSEVQCYRNQQLTSLAVYSWPASSPPIFQFFMKSGKDGHTVCWKWKLCSGESCGSSDVRAGRVNMLLYI